ncbi:ribonuclease P protein component [Catellatospora sp. KI3]|uniref:ribonuclease P protein component n=1 Tax=Catellatospora sp. KI3 TaxID=3041620 RepID=UPI002482C1F3|nr:ribonuclease P protein component [Catellatospora sp. KI3]MDI1464147.1 ribonuclease P protein component [Catellatospora sp. KI3]
MLPAAHRLRRSSDFATAVRAGRRAGRGAVVVHLMVPTGVEAQTTAWSERETVPDHAVVMPGNGPAEPARVGFVVSKAVGKAVTRNTVKRRLRHLAAERVALLPAGALLVVRAQPSAATTPYAQLGRDLDAALTAAARGRADRAPRPAPTGNRT